MISEAAPTSSLPKIPKCRLEQLGPESGRLLVGGGLGIKSERFWVGIGLGTKSGDFLVGCGLGGFWCGGLSGGLSGGAFRRADSRTVVLETGRSGLFGWPGAGEKNIKKCLFLNTFGVVWSQKCFKTNTF